MTAMSTAKEITNDEFDQRFDNGEDILDYCDLENPVIQAAVPCNNALEDGVQDGDVKPLLPFI